MKDIDTIRATAKRLEEEGNPVGEYALRRWVKNGLIRSIQTGNKALVNYQEVKEFLGLKQEMDQAANMVERAELDIAELGKYPTKQLIAEILLRIERAKKLLREETEK